MQKFYEGLGGQEGGNNVVEKAKAIQAKLGQRLQVLLDKSTPKPLERWLALGAVLLAYFIRVRTTTTPTTTFMLKSKRKFLSRPPTTTTHTHTHWSNMFVCFAFYLFVGLFASRVLYCDVWTRDL